MTGHCSIVPPPPLVVRRDDQPLRTNLRRWQLMQNRHHKWPQQKLRLTAALEN